LAARVMLLEKKQSEKNMKEESSDKNLIQETLNNSLICPNCGKSELQYDGMLNLYCPKCGYLAVGGFT